MKKIVLLSCIIISIAISIFSISLGMQDAEISDIVMGSINATYLNIRSGPGVGFKSIDVLKKSDLVQIYGKIRDWYIVQTEKDLIGCVHSKYIDIQKEETASSSSIDVIQEEFIDTSAKAITDEEQELLSLINSERAKNNLAKLEIDSEVQNIARLKAQDLVDNNYFAHISPLYGTPFEMLKNNSVNYKTASENIAGNKSVEGAVSSWMNSEAHKNNILSNDYNYTGVAVVDSVQYGKILVEFFIGR